MTRILNIRKNDQAATHLNTAMMALMDATDHMRAALEAMNQGNPEPMLQDEIEFRMAAEAVYAILINDTPMLAIGLAACIPAFATEEHSDALLKQAEERTANSPVPEVRAKFQRLKKAAEAKDPTPTPTGGTVH